MRRRGKISRRRLFEIAAVVMLFGIMVWLGQQVVWPVWTGFGARPRSDGLEPGKTLWDWLELLIVPVGLALIAFWFNQGEKGRERELATDQQREDALQAYLDKMGELLIKEKLRGSEEESEVRHVARARTLTVLERLDPQRKLAVLQFVYESNLIDTDNPVLNLSGAKFVEVELSRAKLNGAHLSRVVFIETDLSEAEFIGANLSKAILIDVIGLRPNFSRANLRDAKFVCYQPDFLKMNRRKVKIVGVQLVGANFMGADLTNAYLGGADLTGAIFTGAILDGAQLYGAQVTIQQLKQACSLAGIQLDYELNMELQRSVSASV
ncbi:MAG: hypothetical protein CYG59_24820, partial [Chloroflexi bacterium]